MKLHNLEISYDAPTRYRAVAKYKGDRLILNEGDSIGDLFQQVYNTQKLTEGALIDAVDVTIEKYNSENHVWREM